MQPIDALAHPKFRELINVAARAPDGVSIPGRKQTRNEILDAFKSHLTELRERMNVGQHFLHTLLRKIHFFFSEQASTRISQSHV